LTPKESAVLKDPNSSNKKEKKKMNINSPIFSSDLKTDKIPIDSIEKLSFFIKKCH
jgi:hypothetical protein